MTLTFTYGVKDIYGIKYGYKGNLDNFRILLLWMDSFKSLKSKWYT